MRVTRISADGRNSCIEISRICQFINCLHLNIKVVTGAVMAIFSLDNGGSEDIITRPSSMTLYARDIRKYGGAYKNNKYVRSGAITNMALRRRA